MSAPTIVPVHAASRSYEVMIGSALLPGIGSFVLPLLPRLRTAIITDSTVASLYLPTVAESLRNAGIHFDVHIIPCGEAAKNFSNLQAILSFLIECGIERSDAILALGGGVIGDIAGMAAALLRRGCAFVQIPTTLLAQVDSSVGGKTAVNMPQGKNLVGAFHQPRLVLADTDTLATLSPRELRAGYAEVIKYGLINDTAFFAWLENNGAKVLSGDTNARRHAIATSVRAKADIVARDETESAGVRELLNLGHTFGHALEAATGFSDALLHGEAVALGMRLAFDFSVWRGLCPASDAARVRTHLQSSGLPVALRSLTQDSGAALVKHMLQDKKMRDGKLPFLLTRGIGQTYLAPDVGLDDVVRFLDETD
jgi:3-dehydroquinate synthase